MVLMLKLTFILISLLYFSNESKNEGNPNENQNLNCHVISGIDQSIEFLFDEIYINSLNNWNMTTEISNNRYSLIVIIPDNFRITKILFEKIRNLFSNYKTEVKVDIFCSDLSDKIEIILLKDKNLISSKKVYLVNKNKKNLQNIRDSILEILEIIDNYEFSNKIDSNNIDNSVINQELINEILEKYISKNTEVDSQIDLTTNSRNLKEKNNFNSEMDNSDDFNSDKKKEIEGKCKLNCVNNKPLSINLLELRKLEDRSKANTNNDDLLHYEDKDNHLNYITNSKQLSNNLVNSFVLINQNENTTNNATINPNKGFRFLKVMIILIFLILFILILIRYSLIWANDSQIEINRYKDNDRKLIIEKLKRKNLSIARLEFS